MKPLRRDTRQGEPERSVPERTQPSWLRRVWNRLFGPPKWFIESEQEAERFRQQLREKIRRGTSHYDPPAS